MMTPKKYRFALFHILSLQGVDEPVERSMTRHYGR